MRFIDFNGKEHKFDLRTQFGVKRKSESRSLPQWKLGRLVSKIYGRKNVFEDYPLPNCGNVSWDFWVPNFEIAFEYHGRQHDEFVSHFHGTHAGFDRQKASDAKKKTIAEMNGITLIILRAKDFKDWTVEELKELIMEQE